jgi:hypothetical protein
MPISKIRLEAETALLSFAWEQWAQMGILAPSGRSSPWAQDPEALLVFTFELARADPRLFDEVLDWLVTNEPLISVRRLRSLSRDPSDTALTEAVLGWLGQHRPKARFSTDAAPEPSGALQLLHADAGFPIRHPDEAFAAHGWLRPATTASRKARPPDLRAPINFAFRMRQLLGMGARAEVVRLLLTTDAPRTTAAVIAKSAMYAKRNVQEVLNGLEHAGVVTITSGGNEQRYGIDREAWRALLAVEDFPSHVDWAQLLGALRRTLRWLRRAADSDMSEYITASEARDLLEDVRPDFEYAGIVLPRRQTSAEAVDDLRYALRQSLSRLQPEGIPSAAGQVGAEA